MNRNIKKLIRKKQRSYNKAKRTKKKKDWENFRSLRRQVKICLEKEHQKYIGNLLDIENDITNIDKNTNLKSGIGKRFWSYIKSTKRDSSGVSTLITNNESMESSKQKAEALNKQFESVFTNEDMNNIPDLGKTTTPDIRSINIKVEGVAKLLKNINPKKANGPDQISCRILKETATEIAPYLKLIFDKTLEENDVPKDWKMANITALYKKGDKSKPVNYRPVSLTSVPCKLLEHIIFKHIMEHLEEHNILVDFQHGFRQGRSCESQLIITVEEIARSLDNKQQVDLLILDFSKAFDTVPHTRLLNKLEHYGINGNINGWIKSWLTQREQKVLVEGEESSAVQGTVLGPLMFLLYINDIGNNISSHIRLFADDSLLYLAVSTRDDCEKLQRDLTSLVKWSETWQMVFNATKCYVLRICKGRNTILYPYSMNGHILDSVTHNPYLGVEFTSTLSWELHINNIVNKANRSLGFLRRNLGKFPENVKRQAYLALVRPHLEYASSVWDPYLQKHKDQLEMVQRRSARFISNNYAREPGTVTSLLQHLQLPPLEERRKISRLLLFHKAYHNNIAIPIPEYVIPTRRNTRQSHQRRFIRLGSTGDQYKHSFFSRTIKDWNDVPPDIISIDDYEAFKTRLVAHLTFTM